MKHKSLRLGFDVTMEKGATWKPLSVRFWNQESQFSKHKPSAPLKYMADALVGLSLIKLNHYIKSPLSSPHIDYTFAVNAWRSLEPHIELYERSHHRMRALQSHLAVIDPKVCQEFESLFDEQLDIALKPWGIDVTALGPLLETFSWFENKMGSNLLYNFGINFSKPFIDKLHSFFSFLYHLRSLVAVDHNAQIDDPSHEGVKLDAIADYLPRAEYIVNDALIYWNFQKLAKPFFGPKNKLPQIEKDFVTPMDKIFSKYAHNSVHLVDNLPKSFLNSLNPVELEEAFYLVQIDWLLGSPAGLLFKIREEIFALQDGYEKLFWKDVEPKHHSKPVSLHLSCELLEEEVFGKSAA